MTLQAGAPNALSEAGRPTDDDGTFAATSEGFYNRLMRLADARDNVPAESLDSFREDVITALAARVDDAACDAALESATA